MLRLPMFIQLATTRTGIWSIRRMNLVRHKVLSLLLTGFFGLNCATSVPLSDDIEVASELSVVTGRDPVLFVGRNPEDGQWIVLTDQRASRQVVVYALFDDLLTLDSTLNQVRDLRIGWQATRLTKGAPWVKGPFSMTSQMQGQELTQEKASHSQSESVGSEHYSIMVFERDEISAQGRQINVEEKSVSVWLVEGSENTVETLLWSSGLDPVVRASLDSLVQRCGLDTLKDHYSNPFSPGGKKFRITIWDAKRGHSTSSELNNCWVPSLYVLCSRINSLLPKRYTMDLAIL